jgi:hypothetical protein
MALSSSEERMVRTRGVVAGAATVALTAVGAMATPQAQATTDQMPINGTFIARSMGEWAQTRDSYHDEATITSTWTITSTCSAATACTGTVTSDAGWTAPLTLFAGSWEIHREIPNWEPCADGTAYTGHQTIRFWGVDENGTVLFRQSQATQFAGEDRTIADSGACGINQWLVIKMPFTMRKVA